MIAKWIIWNKMEPCSIQYRFLLDPWFDNLGSLLSCRIPNSWSRNSYNTTVAFLSSHVIVLSISHMVLLQISQFVVNNWNLKTIVATSNHIICSIQCIGDRNQNHPQEKEMQKSKMAVWGGLTNSSEMKGSEKQKRKGKTFPFECRVPKKGKER